MNTEFPQKVLRIENDLFAENFSDREEAEKINDIDVCSYETELPEIIEKFCLPPDISIGDTLVRSPYDKETYWHIEDYEDKVAREKASIILQIAQLLGANHYSYNSHLKSMEERCSEFNADGTYKVVDVSVDVKKKEEEIIKGAYTDADDFPNAPERPSQEEFNEAMSLAKVSGLLGEPDVKALLKVCDPSKRNRLGQRKVIFSASTEANKALDIAFKLNVMKDVFKLNAGFHNSTKFVKSMQMTFIFTFPY